MSSHSFLFTRTEGMEGVTAAAVLTVQCADEEVTHAAALALFEDAVTEWLHTTEAGRKAEWPNDFNIGDFLTDSVGRDPEFTRMCLDRRFFVSECSSIAWDQHVTYDRILNQGRDDDPPTCILDGEPGENPDDCTTHEHENHTRT